MLLLIMGRLSSWSLSAMLLYVATRVNRCSKDDLVKLTKVV
jgi:hypothetical protein